jgi:hypothetical protein
VCSILEGFDALQQSAVLLVELKEKPDSGGTGTEDDRRRACHCRLNERYAAQKRRQITAHTGFALCEQKGRRGQCCSIGGERSFADWRRKQLSEAVALRSPPKPQLY